MVSLVDLLYGNTLKAQIFLNLPSCSTTPLMFWHRSISRKDCGSDFLYEVFLEDKDMIEVLSLVKKLKLTFSD